MVIDRDYHIVLANRAARELANGEDSIAGHRTCYSVSHHRDAPCDDPDRPCPMEQVIRTKTPVTVEHTHHDAEGAEVVVEITAAPIFDDAGEVVSIVESCHDITEHKQAATLIADLARFPSENPDPVLRVSADGTVVFANRASGLLLEAWGCRSGQVLPSQWAAVVRDALTSGQKREAEVVCGERVVGVTFAPVTDADYVNLYARDVTERKQANDALQKAHDELEDRVDQRTAELALANREMEAFVYSVSHDLRAPLRGIDGFSAALLDEYGQALDEQGRGYLARVRAASGRMAELIDDLLGLSRIGQIEMACETVDLSALAEKIAAGFRAAEPDRRVTFEIAGGLTADGDSPLLRVLLAKLIENAWKFTSRHPEARVEFGTAVVDNERAFFVRDDGAGFDMAYVKKLFGPFQRLHSVDEFPGTGIGLATAERIVHRHGGRIWAHGEVEQGATFYFTLPHRPDS